MTAAENFTAAQIAACLGLKAPTVREALKQTTPAGVRVVGGNQAATYALGSLPHHLQRRLTEEAAKRGYRSAEAMVAEPPKAWEPPIPLSQVCDDDVADAVKKRQALKPLLLEQHTWQLSRAEMDRRGVDEYAKAFGHRVTERHWRELFARTIRRDGGAERWDRLELYLPERPRRKQLPARSERVADEDEFSEITSYLEACSDPTRLSMVQERAVWTLAFEHYERFIRLGANSGHAARRVRDFLFARVPGLAPTRDALLKSFQRKLERWERSHGSAKALQDGRQENGVEVELPEADRDLLVHRAVFYYRGDIAPAWRDLLNKGFTEGTRARYAGKAANKSHVPKTVRESVSAEVEILTVMYQGKRAFDSIKGHVLRSYEAIHSLQCMVADDFTMPVYYYVPDGNGWYNLTRGQILIFLDFRTLAVLGWSMQPDRTYSSLTIRSLCTTVFSEHGVPEVLQFERGIWKSSTLLKGRDPDLDFTETVQGLKEFGIRFIHSIRPRSKTVERVGGLLQDLMEGEPGYCGRDERRDAPEVLRKQMAEVAKPSGEHPSKYFYSYEQWEQRFGAIVNAYNSAKQQGRILDGLSPDEALVALAGTQPPMTFAPEVRYLLAHHKEVKRVTLNGITFKIGKQTFNYKSAELGLLVGREVLAWFDPENPEVLIVTGLDRSNPISVMRSKDPSALECVIDPDSEGLANEMRRVEAQAAHMKARFHAVKAKGPMPQRKLLADAQTLQLGQEISSERSRAQGQQEVASRRRAQVMKHARELNMTLPDRVVQRPETKDALSDLAELMQQADESEENEG